MFEKLIDWSQDKYHHLPWRKNRSLYGTLVSEIMLQQTTVSTVLGKFEQFLEKFPDIKSLSQTSEEEMLIAWKGLGYYRRARNLRKAAIYIQENFQGEIPLDKDELLKVDGIGEYTASAIRAIGARKIDIAVDANLERVLSRYYGVKEFKGPKLQKKIQSLFSEEKILQDIKILGARETNEALMDLGRIICKASEAYCHLCPLRDGCITTKLKDPTVFPVQTLTNKEDKTELKLLRVLYEKNGKLAAIRREKGQWLEGQYEFPTFILEDIELNQYNRLKKNFNFELLPSYKTSITKYKIENFVLRVNDKDLKELKIDPKAFVWDYKVSNLSTASQKALSII